MKKYGFGIIGLGFIASMHLKAVESLDNAYFVAGYDNVPNRANEFCEKWGGIPYADLDEFLNNDKIDIVTITTPSGAHLDVALAAIRKGKHVIIEKPLEVTVERCNLLIEEAKKYNVLLSGIFQSRFYEVTKIVKNAINKGRFGQLTMANAVIKWSRTQEYYDSAAWRGTIALDGGGAFMNQGIHAIDILQYLMGDVTEVTAYTDLIAHERIEVEDNGVAILRFKNGALGVIESSTSVFPGFLKKVEISGTEGSCVIEEEDLIYWNFKHELPEDEYIRNNFCNNTTSGGGAADPSTIAFHGHALNFEDVILALECKKELELPGEEAKKSVEIIEAVYKSSKTKQAVKLPL